MFPTEPDSTSGDPSACSDGRYLVFDHRTRAGKGSRNIWRADAGGGNLKQLSTGKLDQWPVCSPDARWVYYLSGSSEIMRVPIDGGAPRKITEVPANSLFDISPDGSTVAFLTVEHAGDHEVKMALVQTETGKVRKLLKFEKDGAQLINYAPDGKALVFSARENGVDNLWQQPVDGSPGKKLTSFKSEYIYDFHWSFDGSKLALVQGHSDSDVVLMHEQRP